MTSANLRGTEGGVIQRPLCLVGGSDPIKAKTARIGLMGADMFRNHLFSVERFDFNQLRSKFQSVTL